MLNSNKIRSTLLALAGALAMSGYAVADGARQIDVGAGRLTTALKELAAQSGVEFVYSTDELEGMETKGVHGQLTAEEAIDRLLEGTPLKVTRHPSGALVITVGKKTTGSPAGSSLRLAQADQDISKGGSALRDQHEKGLSQLEEITVTAQKRAENSQDISVAVQVVSGAQLERLAATTTADLGSVVPGLIISNNTGSSTPTISIRGVGVGAASFFANQPNSTAVNVDGVYLPSAIMSNFQLFDINRVEVLKGPQGTLYGRNTTAGAINFISRRPTAEPNGYVQAAYSRWNTVNLESAFGGAISDQLRYRIAVAHNSSDGDVINTYRAAPDFGPGERHTNGINRSAFRAQAEWLPDGQTTVLLNLHGGLDRSENFHYQVMPAQLAGNPDPFARDDACTSQYQPVPGMCLTGSQKLSQVDTDGSHYRVNSNLEEPSDIVARGASLEVNRDFGSSTLTSITAFDQYKRFYAEDEDGGPLTELHVIFDENFRYASQEVRLASQSNQRFTWIAGAYGSRLAAEMKRHADFTDLLDFGIVYRNKIRETALAGFFHSTYDLTEKVRMIAGVRYSYEQKSIVITNADVAGNTPWLEFENIFDYRTDGEKREKHWNNVSGKVGLEYRPVDGVLLYGHWSRGFKSGGFPGSIGVSSASLRAYNPEFVDAWELGSKTEFADGRAILNLAAFYINYKDKQETAYLEADHTFTDFTNAASAVSKGAELQFAYKFYGGLGVSTGLAYVDSRYKSFANAPDGIDHTGSRLPYAPKLSANATVNQTLRIGNATQLDLVTSVSYVDRIFFDASNFLRTATADPYWLWNGSLTLSRNDSGLSTMLIVRNITDNEFRVGGGAGVTGDSFAIYGQRRSIGIQFRYDW